MNEYIFRFPAGCPDLDFESLLTWMQAPNRGHEIGHGGRKAKIGTTVLVVHRGPFRSPDAALPPAFDIWLHDLLIARVFHGRVWVTGTDDPHQATTAWLARIIQDNAIGTSLYRVRRRKADDPGPAVARGRAGLLVIDSDRSRPALGHLHQAGDIAALKASRAETRTWIKASCEEYAQAAQRRNRRFYADLHKQAAAGGQDALMTLIEHGHAGEDEAVNEDLLRRFRDSYPEFTAWADELRDRFAAPETS